MLNRKATVLTPMQEIFILLEDEKIVPMFRLQRWGLKSRGALAKLNKYGWVEKSILDHEPAYKISDKGEKAIDDILKPLKETGDWDGKWRLVMFDVPESERNLRDKIRRALTSLGFGILQASVWITPKNLKDEIEKLSQKYSLGPSIRYFEVSRNQNLDKTILEKSWDLPELSDDYKMFNLRAEQALRSIDKITNQSFAAKKLIFEYALILKKDPILPWEYRKEDPLRKQANDYYLQLRTYTR